MISYYKINQKFLQISFAPRPQTEIIENAYEGLKYFKRVRETILPDENDLYSSLCKGAQGSQQEGPEVP